VRHLERGVQTKESRHLTRVVRSLFSTRKRLNDYLLKRLINFYYTTPGVQADKEFLLSFIDQNATSASAAAAAATSVAVCSLLLFRYLS
jgi:hypothetical protein